ncbi:hypothetical protein MKZ38_001256 [Zalerion maritima]|uniref:Uncharacterized protein n=1 Tax=Zalerion maritima TaxID=339359 RepID=A0AAD5WLK7_9PEZI|nr:hypothetical protein MKZ38_001256 [Zalerion maritima]
MISTTWLSHAPPTHHSRGRGLLAGTGIGLSIFSKPSDGDSSSSVGPAGTTENVGKGFVAKTNKTFISSIAWMYPSFWTVEDVGVTDSGSDDNLLSSVDVGSSPKGEGSWSFMGIGLTASPPVTPTGEYVYDSAYDRDGDDAWTEFTGPYTFTNGELFYPVVMYQLLDIAADATCDAIPFGVWSVEKGDDLMYAGDEGISGYTSPIHSVVVILDGEELDEIFVGEDGSWSYSLPEALEGGEHTIEILSTWNDLESSKMKKVTTCAAPDTDDPSSTPADTPPAESTPAESTPAESTPAESTPHGDGDGSTSSSAGPTEGIWDATITSTPGGSYDDVPTGGTHGDHSHDSDYDDSNIVVRVEIIVEVHYFVDCSCMREVSTSTLSVYYDDHPSGSDNKCWECAMDEQGIAHTGVYTVTEYTCPYSPSATLSPPVVKPRDACKEVTVTAEVPAVVETDGPCGGYDRDPCFFEDEEEPTETCDEDLPAVAMRALIMALIRDLGTVLTVLAPVTRGVPTPSGLIPTLAPDLGIPAPVPRALFLPRPPPPRGPLSRSSPPPSPSTLATRAAPAPAAAGSKAFVTRATIEKMSLPVVPVC